MRTTTDEINVWLVGYYDDFQSSKSIADDLNAANATSTDHTITHHGNPMNGEAFNNPTFRYSYADRAQYTTYLVGSDSFSAAQLFTTTSPSIKNEGHHQWLTLDLIRNNKYDWEGRAQLQYPDSRRGTRQRFSGAAGDSYEAFVNAHDTRGLYYAPLGVIDSTAGRSRVYAANAADNDGDMYEGAGSHIRVDVEGQYGTKSISLAGVLMGEQMNTSSSSRGTSTKNLYPLKSPAGKPFLVSKLFGNSTGRHRILNYDGPMQFVGLGDTFNMRIAAHAMGGWGGERYTLNLGYKKADGFNKSNQTFGSNPLLTLEIPISNLGSYNSGNYLSINNYTASDNNGQWTDIDVVLDFSANTYKAYADGTLFSNGAFSNNWSAGDIYGWSLDVNCTGSMSKNVGMITCIDRAALYIPLGDAVQDTNYTPITSLTIDKQTNALSTVQVVISDDDNRYGVSGLISAEGFTEWDMIVFRDNLDRPIFWGTLSGMAHTQNPKSQTLDTLFVADEKYSLLDRQLPVWETGQNAYLSREGHLALNTQIEKNYNLVKNMGDILNTGTKKLTFNNSTIGFESSDFTTADNQRTSLGSSHPIQMYINEDVNGPNNAEKDWDGYDSPKYMLADTRYIFHPTTNFTYFVIDSTAHLVGSSGVSASNTIMSTFPDSAGTRTFTVSAITTMSRSGNAPDETPTSYKLLKVANSNNTTLTPTALCSQYQLLYTNLTDSTKKRLRFTTASAHGLTLGSKILFGSVIDPSSNNDPVSQAFLFDGGRYRILGVPSSTTFDIEVTNMTITTSAAQNFGAAGYRLPIINESGYSVTDNNLHIVGKDQTDYYTGKEGGYYRNVHTRWMRDISESLWFKSKFGVISKTCYHSAGKNTITNNPVAPTLASAYSQDTATFTGISSFTTSSTTLSCDDPAIWYYNVVLGKPGILDVIDPITKRRDTILFDGTSTPSTASLSYIQLNSGAAVTIDGNAWRNGFQVSDTTIKIWDIVVHTGFDNSELNGVFQVSGIYTQTGGVTKYVAVRIKGYDSKVNNASTVNTSWFDDPDDMWPLITRNSVVAGVDIGSYVVYEYTDKISAPTTTNASYNVASFTSSTGSIYFGSYNIQNVKGQRTDWTSGDFLYRYRQIDESNGYKHLWLLWSDMRNDGNADANDGKNISDFGLMLPTTSNYDLDLVFADQFDSDGDNTPFTSLKIGEEVDIWNIDADAEPYTGNDWSDLANASDTYKIGEIRSAGNTNPYSDWKNKGGSFLIIDTSRFFNMNTEATNGRPGYEVGGLAHFDDYDIPIAGTPYLLDAYWKKAVASYQNSGTLLNGTTTSNIANHPNQFNFLNDATLIDGDSIIIDQTSLVLQDATHFNLGSGVDGYGVIVATSGQDRYLYALRWNGVTGNTLTNVYIGGYTEMAVDPVSIRQFLDDSDSEWTLGSRANIQIKDPANTSSEGYDSVVVYNTPAALYGFRLLMSVDGYVSDKNSGTYYDSDKIRMLQNTALLNTWTRNSHLPAIVGIKNVPLTRNMTTTQIAHAGTDYEDFGSVTDIRNNTFQKGIDTIRRNSGSGSSGTNKIFSRVVGRDGMYDYRPSFNLNLALTRSNIKNANMKLDATGIVTNIRAYYDGNKAFVDYPEATTGTEARWKILDLSKVRTREEALALAQKEYDIKKSSAMSVDVQLIGTGTEKDPYLSGGKYGYIADPAVVTLEISNKEKYACSWTSLFGGIPYPGMCNAMDGISRSDKSNAIRAAIFNDRTSDLSSKLVILGCSEAAGGNGGIRWTASSLEIDWSKTHGGGSTGTFTIPDPSVSGFGSITSGSDKITFYYSAGMDLVADDNEQIEYINTFPAKDYYSNYGAKSISHALQIVHIPKSTPSVSANWGSELRFCISVTSGTSADDAEFTVHAIDYAFANTGGVSQFTATHKSNSSVLVNGNGFYELGFPSTYGATAGAKMIISVNTDYLRAILRTRCGDQIKNGSNIPGLSTFTSTDTRSLFPLGMKIDTGEGGISNERVAWYAPRLNVVDDVNYYPATNVTLTDTHIDLSSQSMIVRNVNYQRKNQKTPNLSLTLERNEARYKKTLASLFSDGKPTGGIQEGEGQQGNQASNPQGQGPSSPNKEGGMRDGGFKLNTMSLTTMSRVSGKTEFKTDAGSSDAEWGVIGQKKIATTSTASTTVDGFDAVVTGSGSVSCSDGFVLPGTYIDGDGVARTGVSHEQSFTVRVPSDSVDSFVVLKAQATLDGTKQTASQNAVLTIKVESEDNTNYGSNTITIGSTSTDRKEYVLFSQKVKGAVAGSNLKITITRNPGSGSDTASYRALRVHNVSLSTTRATNPSKSSAKTFKPYS